MRNWTGMAAVVSVAVVAVLAAVAPGASSDPGAALLREAGYEFRYFGKDLGDEHFTITRTPDGGYRIDAELRVNAGDHRPARGTYLLDADRRLVHATYQELEPGGARAEYIIDGRTMIARGLGGAATGEHRFELEEGAVVTGPHYVTDFFVLQPLGLEIGEEHEQTAYAFGFKGWKPSRLTLKSTRTADETVKDMSGRRVRTTTYRCRIVTKKDVYKTKSHLDADGVSVRISVGAPVGSMKVILDAREAEDADGAAAD